MPRSGLLSQGWQASAKPTSFWWVQAGAARWAMRDDASLDQDLAAIVREARARYARHGDPRVNPSRAEVRETLRRLAEEVSDDDMLRAVRILDSETMMHLRGRSRVRLRDTSARGAPLIAGPERIRTLARLALAEMPLNHRGKSAPAGVDLWFARRLVLYWNARHKDKAAASQVPTKFVWWFRDRFNSARSRATSIARQRELIRKTLLTLKRERYTRTPD